MGRNIMISRQPEFFSQDIVGVVTEFVENACECLCDITAGRPVIVVSIQVPSLVLVTVGLA